MKIYHVEYDYKTCQSIVPTSKKISDSDLLEFDATPKLKGWKTVKFQILDPHLPRGDFLVFSLMLLL
ncbi:MAG TPA: hypothetical protein DET40_09695 [Lentisphaeria bacterium]|nr:MAG: hypothetical protein A2X45_08480 [Lentisphaerae bacterium GWF2_50_93]HCE43807.1 hypothetical protein [Lentisphaeria bacterium]